jgi:N-acylglucosamine-6-phosphate 2-epimerase
VNELVERLSGGLIVSCQAYPGEPMRHTGTIARVARAAVHGGAAAIRVQGLEDIHAVKDLGVPVIGLVKEGADGVFITPTLQQALAVATAGAQIVALDGTRRPRPDALTLAQTIGELREQHPVLIMADCGSLADACAAEEAGADIVATTLAGYTQERSPTKGPDVALVREMAAACSVPIVAEGRIHTPADAAAVLRAGAHAVCVGTAITHPTTITSWFVAALGVGEV